MRDEIKCIFEDKYRLVNRESGRELLRILRFKCDLKQKEMADICGLSRSMYQRIESGKKSMQMINVMRLCEFFDLEVCIEMKQKKG